MNPRFPIYIPSKGRWDKPLTAERLRLMGVPHVVVVEPAEADAYRKALGPERVVVLPFGNLGLGSIPARNWIWEHAKAAGAEWHWVMDDNIARFYRMTLNRRIPVASGTILAAAEDFVTRYENVGMAALNNIAFAPDRECRAPYTLNTRCYSMILVKTDLPFRWRGRYNEDTDLSLRVLKLGLCTVLFNAFLGDKITTLTMKGGNTDTIYNTGDHRREFAESLQRQHPDVARVVWKFRRWHHSVDYSKFRMRLQLRRGITPTGAPNEYGMRLKRRDTEAITVRIP